MARVSRSSSVGQALRLPLLAIAASGALALQFLAGCATPQVDRPAAAQQIFSAAVKAHNDREFDAAAAGYERILRQYRDQPGWCAPALRSLGNVRAAQGQLAESIRLYDRVGREYATYDWEVLQAWKTAADLLWDAGREPAARVYYARIVQRFDKPAEPAVVQTIVRAAKSRR